MSEDKAPYQFTDHLADWNEENPLPQVHGADPYQFEVKWSRPSSTKAVVQFGPVTSPYHYSFKGMWAIQLSDSTAKWGIYRVGTGAPTPQRSGDYDDPGTAIDAAMKEIESYKEAWIKMHDAREQSVIDLTAAMDFRGMDSTVAERK